MLRPSHKIGICKSKKEKEEELPVHY